MIAKKVLCGEGQFSVSALIKQGRIKEAKDRVLEGIDSCYWDWHISFTEAAGFYNLLDLPQERASKFPQRHNQAFF
jgi:hypothetical protein